MCVCGCVCVWLWLCVAVCVCVAVAVCVWLCVCGCVCVVSSPCQAYVDAAEARYKALQASKTPHPAAEVFNVEVLHRACKAYALYHCHSSSGRRDAHVTVSMLGIMERVKAIVDAEAAEAAANAVDWFVPTEGADAVPSPGNYGCLPDEDQTPLQRLFTTTPSRTGSAVRLWHAAGRAADDFADRLSPANLPVLAHALVALAPAHASTSGVAKRALALPPQQAFGGVFAKVGAR